MFKKISNLLFLVSLLTLASLIFGSHKAQAATLNVVSGTDAINNNGQCQLSEAITNINNQTQTFSDCLAGNGNNDTINLPSGTITLSGDLPSVDVSLKVSGAGRSATIINGDGFLGFHGNSNSNRITKDVTIEKMTISNAYRYAVDFQYFREVMINQLDVNNSALGVAITNAKRGSVTNSYIHDNIELLESDGFSGLKLSSLSLLPEDVPNFTVTDTQVVRNTAIYSSGLFFNANDRVSDNSGVHGGNVFNVRNVNISQNESKTQSGLIIVNNGGPTSVVQLQLLVEATTIANNVVTVTSPQVISGDNIAYPPLVAGVMITGILADQQNFNNVTAANNIINAPSPENRHAFAGIFGSLGEAGAPIRFTNTTVVGNTLNEPSSTFDFPAFTALRVTLDFSNFPTIGIVSASSGSSALNALIAHNTTNGTQRNCLGFMSTADLIGFGNVSVDLTPINLGHNISDDQTCTGYNYFPDIYNTIQHNVTDNGGPVPTIALLPGSPAISAGGSVLGISTDARGIARPNTPDVGAYQTVQGASTSNPNTFAGISVPSAGLGGKNSKHSYTTIRFIGVVTLLAIGCVTRKRTLNIS